MIEKLEKTFNSLELSWIDTSTEIVQSTAYSEILSIFSNLEDILQDGIVKDEEEFQRTIRHIFRLFKIFFLIKSGNFIHDTLSSESLIKIKEKLFNQHFKNKVIIPIILMYHDVGRLDDKKEHPYYSYYLISKRNMLDQYNVSDTEQLLIKKIIQYHLLFATIYTGESTFYGISSLLNDSEFNILLINKENIDRFIDLLEIFTYIDILGYSYARIYNHYVSYYDEINSKLKSILNSWPDKEKALKKANEYSQEWIEWRTAGALRIFQYVNTEPYLTKTFYYEKIRNSVNMDIKDLTDGLEWDAIKENYLENTSKIQLKYGLAMIMLLALGKFFRGPIREDQQISSNLIAFWVLLSKEITKRSKFDNDFLWNVHFTGLPNWWKWDRKFKKELNSESLELIIKTGSQEFDERKKEFNLYLDFSSIFNS
ncbi:MAG: hypothetical protein ACW97V_07470 [Promethearchaeota archaeon]|jgi:hypothetical protein